jgi:hypothetical protein
MNKHTRIVAGTTVAVLVVPMLVGAASAQVPPPSVACSLEATAAKRGGVDPDCSVGTSALVIRAALSKSGTHTNRSRRVGDRAYSYVFQHKKKLVRRAKLAYHDRIGKMLHLAKKGHRIIGKAKSAGSAFGGWIKKNGPSFKRVARHFGRAASFCAVPGIAVYLWHRFHEHDSHDKSLKHAEDGCVGGAATYLLTLKVK